MTDEREEALADQGDMDRKMEQEDRHRRLGEAPRYLVQAELGVGKLHGYWDPVILRCDIALHHGVPIKVFKAETELGRLSYHPITVDELKEEK